jgi:hypothetical protein
MLKAVGDVIAVAPSTRAMDVSGELEAAAVKGGDGVSVGTVLSAPVRATAPCTPPDDGRPPSLGLLASPMHVVCDQHATMSPQVCEKNSTGHNGTAHASAGPPCGSEENHASDSHVADSGHNGGSYNGSSDIRNSGGSGDTHAQRQRVFKTEQQMSKPISQSPLRVLRSPVEHRNHNHNHVVPRHVEESDKRAVETRMWGPTWDVSQVLASFDPLPKRMLPELSIGRHTENAVAIAHGSSRSNHKFEREGRVDWAAAGRQGESGLGPAAAWLVTPPPISYPQHLALPSITCEGCVL